MLATELIELLRATIAVQGDVEVRTNDPSNQYRVGTPVTGVRFASEDIEYTRGGGFVGMHSWPNCIVIEQET